MREMIKMVVVLTILSSFSGGLLAAVLPEHADAIVRRLPGAEVVGRVTDGAAGTVRLLAGP